MTKMDFQSEKLGQIDGVYTWQMPVFSDVRGRLFKAYVAGKEGSFPVPFITYEHFFTESKKHVFRGMHFQAEPHAVAKIISLVRGAALIFLLDTRKISPTYSLLQQETVNQNSPMSIYIPIGVALGYLVLEDETVISYRTSGAFCGNCDAGVSPKVGSPYLPIPLEETIRSERDLTLDSSIEVLSPSLCLQEKP